MTDIYTTHNANYSWISPFFELTVGGTVYKFGNSNANQPRLMEGRFEYTYSDSTGATHTVTLNENTIGAAIDAIVIATGIAPGMEMNWWWNVPPSVQWDMEDEGWTAEQITALTIGNHLDLRITLNSLITQ